MKKLFCAAMACMVLLSLASCTGKGTEDADNSSTGTTAPEIAEAPESTVKPESAPREDDFDNRFGQGCVNLAETEDAYYFSPPNGNYIYYHDKQAGDYGVLCAKPECMHD